jgi:GntR family transcriptional regulator/MocR family aminotransferase
MFFGDEIVLDVPLGGMHVIARFVACEDDVAMAARAQRAGLAPFALSSLCTAGGSRQSGLLLSFTNIPVEAAEREVQRLHRSLR